VLKVLSLPPSPPRAVTGRPAGPEHLPEVDSDRLPAGSAALLPAGSVALLPAGSAALLRATVVLRALAARRRRLAIEALQRRTGVGVASGDGDELQRIMGGAVGAVMNVVGMLFSAFCIWAFLKMMRLENRTMAYVAVIASMVPCTGSCCYLNIFVGIWALMTLADPVVKQAYQS